MYSNTNLSPFVTTEILRWIKDDIQTLNSCVLVDKLWSRCAVNILYRDPWSLIKAANNSKKPLKSIVDLLRTLERSTNSNSSLQQYHLHLRTIDLGWIESILNCVQCRSTDSSYGSQVAQLLWSLVSNVCSSRLVDLRTHKTSLTVLIPRDIQLPLLRALEANVETFDEAEASTILRSCPNLRKLHISTQTLCGEQLARVITSLGQNKLQELQVKCVDFSSIYTTIEALVDSQSGSLTSVLFDVDQFHMNRSEEIEVKHIRQAFERLGECSGLRKLELRGMTCIGDECMNQIFDRARHLQEVALQSLDISNQSWDRLLTRSSGHLKSLRLHSKEGRITSLLSSLRKHGRGMHTLDISSMALLPQELREVVMHCPDLEELHLGQFKEVGVDVGDRLVFEILTRCRKMHTLNLGNLKFTEHSLSNLANQACLKQVVASKSIERYIGKSNLLRNYKLKLL